MTSPATPGRADSIIDADVADLGVIFRYLISTGYRLALVAAHHDLTDDEHAAASIRVVYVMVAGPPDTRVEIHLRLPIAHPVLPSVSDVSFTAGRFEREMQDLFGLQLSGHHQPSRLVLHQHWPEGWHPMRHDAGPPPPFDNETESYPFLTVEGPGVYELSLIHISEPTRPY